MSDLSLAATSPCAGMLPARAGALALTEAEARPIWALATPRDPNSAQAALKSLALHWPAANARHVPGAAEIAFFDRQHCILIGAEPSAALQKALRVTDQSDAWAVVLLSGAGATEALTRLSTLDLHAMPDGACARSPLGHMACHYTRLGADHWRLMVFRSMAATMVREVKEAMHHIDARHG